MEQSWWKSIISNGSSSLAYCHHEKRDGSLACEDIPLFACIMAVADVFDALVSKQSYKKPFTFEQAMSIIVESSSKK